MKGLLLTEALDRLCVHLNMYLVYESSSNPPSLVVFHHDLISPIQYTLEVCNHVVSWLLFDGRPMSVKTANDPP